MGLQSLTPSCDFIKLLLMHVAGNNPVSIEPANAGKDGTEPKTKSVVKRKTIGSVWKHFGFKADEKGKPRRLTVQSATSA